MTVTQSLSVRAPLHTPSAATLAGSQMTAFHRFCEGETGRHFPDHASLHQFSVDELRRFWALFLEWSELLHEGSPDPVCTDDACEAAAFFPDLRLGYVENLLRIDADLDGERPALTACDASGRRERLTRRALRDRVARLASSLEALGVAPGDRIVAVAHNDAAAVIAGLAVAALGATFSTASPDMGAFSIVARFAQLDPTLLMGHLRGADADAPTALSDRIAEVARGLPSLRGVLALDDGPVPTGLGVPVHTLSELVGAPGAASLPFAWRRFPFNHPLFILFSSGTTGPPKCIVHGAGGTLVEHVKEHRLHADLRPTDKLFFHTSCAWMMWNWQLSALASGVEIVLYAGAIEGPATLWRLISEEGVTAFGTSPAYLQMCEDAGFSPRRELPLHRLRLILSTGSILHDHQYDWVREQVAPCPLQSISGGTDILGCFVLGNPNLPIFRGESQCRSLGMDVCALRGDGSASPAPGSAIGELVCRSPFPSRPLGLHGDPQGERFHDAYFRQNPGVWTHGDILELTPEGTARIHGRSDGVLNVRGVRLGPVEIYRILQALPEIRESMAVEQQVPGSPGHSRLVLLVVLRGEGALDAALRRRIRKELASRGSPAHVPEIILAVPELPVTHSGKRSERAARDAVNGIAAVNAGALANPESLPEIQRRLALDHSRRAPARDAPPPSPEETALELVVTSAWERALDVGPVSRDEDFFDLGGTSVVALRLCNEIREQTGRELPPSTLFDAPTIARMATAILAASARPFASVVALKPTGQARPLFLVHGLAGDVLELRALAQRLPADRPVLGLRARGLDPRERPHATVEEMAEDYVARVRRWQPAGPYFLAGYSFGGLVAFEMARRLRGEGDEVAFLGLLDTNLHHDCLPPRQRLAFRLLRKVHRVTTRLGAPRSRLLAVARERGRAAIEVRLHATCGEASSPETGPLTPVMTRLEALAWHAFRAYRPGWYGGVVTFFRAGARPPDYCYPIPLWAEVVRGRLDICDVPGDHFAMIREPLVDVLARRLAERLGTGLAADALVPSAQKTAAPPSSAT